MYKYVILKYVQQVSVERESEYTVCFYFVKTISAFANFSHLGYLLSTVNTKLINNTINIINK